MDKYSTSIKYGIIAGIVMIVILLLIYFVSVNALAGMAIYLVYLALIFFMIWGGITVRKESGGYKNYGHAFLTVFIISICGTIMFDSFGFVLYKIIDPQIPVIIKAKMIENTSAVMEKWGVGDEKTEQAIQKIKDQDFTPTVVSQSERMAGSIAIGAIFSALIGLFVNRPEEGAPIKAEE